MRKAILSAMLVWGLTCGCMLSRHSPAGGAKHGPCPGPVCAAATKGLKDAKRPPVPAFAVGRETRPAQAAMAMRERGGVGNRQARDGGRERDIREVVKILAKHDPEGLKRLKKLRDTDPPAFKRTLDETIERHNRRKDAEKKALAGDELAAREARLKHEIRTAVQEFHNSRSDKERGELRERIGKGLAALFRQRLEMHRRQLEKIEAERERLRDDIRRWEREGEAIIGRKIGELTGTAGEFPW